eukprot:TRINITY_DN21889_c0_g2_i1.p1 TRINITY_DN21889_c0_g2~~TRINITY_DN21889_c0_g2_i1.p1  ORF type:complete len:747 (-),score=111.13 TRINITY_DN21889_c0_g2_i1:317-2320(-)
MAGTKDNDASVGKHTCADVGIMRGRTDHVDPVSDAAQEKRCCKHVMAASRRAHSDGSKQRKGAPPTPSGNASIPSAAGSNEGGVRGRSDRTKTINDRSRSANTAPKRQSVSPKLPRSCIERTGSGGTPRKCKAPCNVAVADKRGSRPQTASPRGRHAIHVGGDGQDGNPRLRPPLPSIGSPPRKNDGKLGTVGMRGDNMRRATQGIEGIAPQSSGPRSADGKHVLPAPLSPHRGIKAANESPERAGCKVTSSTPPRQRAGAHVFRTPPSTPPSTHRQTSTPLPSVSPAPASKDEVSGGRQHVASPQTSPRVSARQVHSPRDVAKIGQPPSRQERSSVGRQHMAGRGTAACQVAHQRARFGHLDWLEKVLRPRQQSASTSGTSERCREGQGDPIKEEAAVSFDEITFGEAIGAGSFGAVWKGEYHGQVVAIKQCKFGDRNEATMLLEEIRHLQKLRHSRLVSFLGFCDRPPHIVLLMEYMPGGSLHALLFGSRRHRLIFAQEVRMAGQIAEGLTYLHDLNIVHRDLKTLNIVLDTELNCKICDFGMTVTLERTHLTILRLEGSPRYMAPEQFEDTVRITEKVDVWQFGCVMLELFCMTVPFSHFSSFEQIITELLVQKQGPAIPAEADPFARALIRACLRIKHQARPAAAALEEALRGVAQVCTDVHF